MTGLKRSAATYGAIALGLMLAAAAQAQAPGPPPPAILPGYGPPITLEQARLVMAAAQAEARRRNVQPTIAIVEPSGEPVMYEKATSSQYGGYEFAMGKARTAARYRRTSKSIGDATKPEALFFLQLPGALGAAGGVPIVVQGRIIGAIGESGGADEAVAQAGADALK